MGPLQKCVIAIFPLGFQGKVWTTILHSQSLTVIWESPDVPIAHTLRQLQTQIGPLPDLIMIDTRLRQLRPYALCRWCREHCPEVKVVLVNGCQPEILPSEREWALHQGAAEILPGFQRQTLISRASISMSRILQLLGNLPLRQQALVSSLLAFEREVPETPAPSSLSCFDVQANPSLTQTAAIRTVATFKGYLEYRS